MIGESATAKEIYNKSVGKLVDKKAAAAAASALADLRSARVSPSPGRNRAAPKEFATVIHYFYDLFSLFKLNCLCSH